MGVAQMEEVSVRVQSWEQLSHYEGFSVQGVQVGMAASLSMIIAHTQQVFVLRSGQDLTLQVSTFLHMPVHVCTCLHMSVHVCTCLHMSVHVRTCLHMSTHICTCGVTPCLPACRRSCVGR